MIMATDSCLLPFNRHDSPTRFYLEKPSRRNPVGGPVGCHEEESVCQDKSFFISHCWLAKLLRVSVEGCTLAGGLPLRSVSPSVVRRVASAVGACKTAEFCVQPIQAERCGLLGQDCETPIDQESFAARANMCRCTLR